MPQAVQTAIVFHFLSFSRKNAGQTAIRTSRQAENLSVTVNTAAKESRIYVTSFAPPPEFKLFTPGRNDKKHKIHHRIVSRRRHAAGHIHQCIKQDAHLHHIRHMPFVPFKFF